MKQTLVVVADLGRLKAYRLHEDSQNSHPRLELLEDWETGLTRHLSAEVTDQAGQFRKGTAEGPSSLSDGEQHNLDLELRLRAVKSLAQRIGELIDRERAEGFYLAADRRINQQVLDKLEARNRTKVEKNVQANLSKLRPEELLKHFCE